MDLSHLFEDLWRVVSQDVTIVGGIQGPMLSWIGVTGILALFLWHGTMLLRSLFKLRQILSRFYSSVLPLAVARQQSAKDWLVIPALAKKRVRPNETPEVRRDLDDLQTLDRMFRAEPAFEKEWLSYRKTFAVEQSVWFLEPTVYSRRSATEFFSFEAFCAGQLNVRLYRQLPSFLTGIGLLFTFIAILIGLSKLHANGPHIEGIQGLINGLSGKFVTSIVGLACANAFTLLENSMWHRLENQHRTCLSLLDELFPQKAADHHVPISQAMNGASASVVSPIRSDGPPQLSEVLQQRLSSTMAALTSATQALIAQNSKQPSMKYDDLPREIAHEVQRALRPIMNPLLEAVQDLTRAINSQSSSVQLSQPEIEAMFQELRSHPQEKQ
ncbi:MAG: hypothetical protein OEV99_05640 [Nitrospira sp.]|nr:hypothetical protein [Nitrospira sp.]MDH4369310.1 hypothetical protein [Nitrospira sp.]MDH5346516.1 hypothetical protein [Nitrospira sp.]MDH5497706.1 hypothetical protein [Nitrospira sp.]MDH5725559.1 hypothetical protein [Nitrospira sp.]